jgi:hypothetical protein
MKFEQRKSQEIENDFHFIIAGYKKYTSEAYKAFQRILEIEKQMKNPDNYKGLLKYHKDELELIFDIAKQMTKR